MKSKKVVNISIFNKNTKMEKVLAYTGFVLDRITLKSIIDEDISTGNHVIDCTFLVDTFGIHKSIQEESILKVKTDYGSEIFEIAKIKATPKYVQVFARQITIPGTLGIWLDDVRPTDTNGQGALSHMLARGVGKKEIMVSSNIDAINTAYYKRMNMYKAIGDSDNSILRRWGGEILRRQYTLSINKRIGVDRKVSIQSRKNLTGFESSTDVDKLCTRIKPVGYNGITIEGYVDSALINDYKQIYTREITYPDVKVKDELDPDEGYDTLEQAQEELIRRAKKEFEENKIDELRAEYRIQFELLDKMEETKHIARIERVFIGDTVGVYEKNLNIRLKVRAIRRKYNVLKQRVEEIILTNTPLSEKRGSSVNSIISNIQKELAGADNNIQKYIQGMINAGCKDSYVLYRQNEILIMDSKDINTAINVCRYNKNGMGFSQTGYYGEYQYGFTIDGKMNASLIQTGILTAILLQSVDGKNWINLQTGEINFTKGKILGKNLKIDLDEGTISSKFWNGYNYESLSIGNGKILSDDSLTVSALNFLYLQQRDDIDGIGSSMMLSKRIADFAGVYTHIGSLASSETETNIRGATVNLVGTNINVNDRPLTQQLEAIENILLKQEGII